MQHRPEMAKKGMCLCRQCYAAHETKVTVHEPSQDHPECDDCYIGWTWATHDFEEHPCPRHSPPPPPPPGKKIPGKSGEEGIPSRWYFITFTEHDTVKDPTRVLKSAQRCIKSKAVGATQWAYSLELTQSGTPHVHIRLNTEKYPDYKKCIGAFNDGFRYDIQMEKGGTAKYIIKEESKPSKAWLAQWGLDTWWHASANYSGELPAEIISHIEV